MVRFGDFTAVNEVNFQLNAGDLLGLIGPNGAGKSTLLRAVAGLQETAAGVVEVLGERLNRWSPEAMRHIGFTPDVPPVYDNLTVGQFLSFVARGYDIAGHEIKERIDFWLDKVWLTDKRDQKLSGLSRGMKQRVGIARTLLPSPHLILLDEPASGLDPAGRVQFRELLNELRRQGKAVIVSSHLLADMGEYCSHIGIMSGGRMIRFGTVRDISETGTADRATYRIRLAKTVTDLQRILEPIAGLTDLVQADYTLTAQFSSGEESAANLLAALIRAGLPVCEFAEVKGNLEQVYLNTGVRQVD